MSRKTKFFFDPLIRGVGSIGLIFVRDANPLEIAANPGIQDIYVNCDPCLILKTPDDEEVLESQTGTPVISEMSFEMRDTFESGVLQTLSKVGLRTLNPSGSELSKAHNFSLLSLITSWEPNIALSSEPYTSLPPNGIDVEFYIDGDLKRVVTLAFDSVGTNEDFLYSESQKATYLEPGHMLSQYNAAERTISFIGRDKIQEMLKRFDPKNPDHWKSRACFNELDPNTSRAMLWHVLDFVSRGGFAFDAAAWQAFTIDDVIRCIYDFAFDEYGGWDFHSERSPWKFYPAGIPYTSFLKAGGTLFDRYTPYLCKRENLRDPVDHYETTKFNLIKSSDEDDDIRLHKSYFKLSSDNKTWMWNERPYSLMHREDGWDVITKLCGSLFYGARYTWKNGKPFVTHRPKTRRPAQLRIPPFIKDGSQGTPYGEVVEAVKCEPYGDWGQYPTHRHVKDEGVKEWFGTPYIEIVPAFWANYSDLHEPVNDQSRAMIDWTADIDYYEIGQQHTENNEPKAPIVQQPYLYKKYKFAFECKSLFGLFGNLCNTTFGNKAGGPTNHLNHSEFVWHVMGTNMEMYFQDATHRTDMGGGSFENHDDYSCISPYPGLILYAGGSVNGGRTIDKNIPGASHIDRYYRGCGKIAVPWGDPNPDTGEYDEYKTTESYLDALAICEAQRKLGPREHYTLTLPTLSQYENDYGETGWDAIYPGLSTTLYGRRFEIVRARKSSEEDLAELDVIEIPAMESMPFMGTFVAPTLSGCGHDVWLYGPRYHWRGGGGDISEEAYHKNHNGDCDCGTGGSGGGTDGKIPPRIITTREPTEPAITVQRITGQTAPLYKFVDEGGGDLAGINSDGSLSGKGIKVATGANATMGSSFLISGTVTITTNKITANSRVFLQHEQVIGTQGILSYTRLPGVSFTVASTSGGAPATGDNSKISWFIVEPA